MPEHEHCWHPFQGPIWMVVPDGHIVLKCCECPAIKTEHSAHIRPGHDRLDKGETK